MKSLGPLNCARVKCHCISFSERYEACIIGLIVKDLALGKQQIFIKAVRFFYTSHLGASNRKNCIQRNVKLPGMWNTQFYDAFSFLNFHLRTVLYMRTTFWPQEGSARLTILRQKSMNLYPLSATFERPRKKISKIDCQRSTIIRHESEKSE